MPLVFHMRFSVCP